MIILAGAYPHPESIVRRQSSFRVSPNGFTLVELLAVIAIIGVLAGITIPVVSSVRTTARQARCISNLRQIGVAITGYCHDHNGSFPNTAHSGETANSWIHKLSPWFGSSENGTVSDEVCICPLDPNREKRLHNEYGQKLSSYLLNDRLDSGVYYDPFGRLTAPPPNLHRLSAPTRTHTVFVARDELDFSTSNDHTHAAEWGGNWSKVLDDIAPDRFRSGSRNTDRTNGRSPYLFADGHVTVIPAADFKKRIDSGENPADPP
ncbi:prepilin-type N-terminal cleavage/methylation domain-containing protein [Opitutaceae bacterium TAV1]|nr:prepilin-type N-terminal cleavage/methylation domain-containing protein [Opitutaceae bacterium TAV1]